MEHIWGLNNEGRVGITTAQAYSFLHNHPDKKSRASVISFLNEMVDEGVLSYKERSGKGGYHRVYYPEMTKEEFGKRTFRGIVKKAMQVFPWVKISDVFSEN